VVGFAGVGDEFTDAVSGFLLVVKAAGFFDVAGVGWAPFIVGAYGRIQQVFCEACYCGADDNVGLFCAHTI